MCMKMATISPLHQHEKNESATTQEAVQLKVIDMYEKVLKTNSSAQIHK